MRKQQHQSGEAVALKLTAAERKLVLDQLACLDKEAEQLIQSTPARKPVMLPLDALDSLADCIAAVVNHCQDRRKQKKLESIFQRVQDLLNERDNAEPKALTLEESRLRSMIADESARISEFAAEALKAAGWLRIKTKPLERFWLAPGHRDVLLFVPVLSKSIKNRLSKGEKSFSVNEVVKMLTALQEELVAGNPRSQAAVILVASHLMDRLDEGIMLKAPPTVKQKPPRPPRSNPDVLYQFKITLIGSDPPIWRRIQIQDCTLDRLHEHIQTSMGWTNSHLHDFEIRDERYGDPELLDDGFEDFECVDSTATMVSQVLPKSGERFVFEYEYDFGDCWRHEVLFEGRPPIEKGKKYPICLEGERSCPPEDVGGVRGYEEFLSVINDSEHEDHEQFLEWSGAFDPDAFDAKKATRSMKKGLPDWRTMS